ncbi:MFS transporter [Qaidamihabitans albus]|uniref:MFS transporter n=1 Tax=Qaidamihabitans albus TaxID=2795733 RepID=UPI0018F16BCC|nr:MFS transporter [Qaidamihabitans albus]
MAEITGPVTPDSDSHAAQQRLNLASRLERLPLTRYQKRLFLIIATAWLFDSMDLAALTFILDPISNEFALTGTQSGLLASLSFAGMVVGASTAGMLADRFGRRPVFVTSMLCWGFASLVAAMSWDLTSLLVCRFFIGVGMGAEFPVAQSLLSEFVPAKSRGKYLGLLEGFWPIGFITCGAVSLLVVPALGWRAIYVVMFVLSLYALYLRRAVPESARWHESRGQFDQAERTIEHVEKEVTKAYGKPLPPAGETVIPAQSTVRRAPVRELISRPYLPRTIMTWSLWFTVLLGYYGITTWQSKLLADSGMSIAGSIGFVLLMALWGIPGFLTASFLLEKVGRKPVVIAFVLLSAAASYVYGLQSSPAGLIAVGSVMQFVYFGMWSALYAYTPEVFATRFRATGCGTASAFGRIGALVGPLVVPFALTNWGHTAAFAVAGASMVVGAIAVAVLGPETKNKALEEVSR